VKCENMLLRNRLLCRRWGLDVAREFAEGLR